MSQTVANVSAIVFVFVTGIAFLYTRVYAPPEMNDGVIYRFGKFNRFVPDGEWDMTIPFIEKVRVQSISRFVRSVNVVLASVLSADNDPCTLTLQATYKLDLPRLLANDTSEICEALKRSDADWNGIVIYWIERLARQAINESQTSFLKKKWWKDGLEDMISVNLSQKLAGAGIVMSPSKSVQVVDSVPISALEKARQEREINLIKAQSNREMLLSIAPLFSQCDDPGYQMLQAAMSAGIARGEGLTYNPLFNAYLPVEQRDSQTSTPNQSWG
ncbi:MAG TPA: SPFH domain-containing protein [Thermoflexales bacterium]|nr:SPFH domain-containing protein [Thermoflexales bacterium]